MTPLSELQLEDAPTVKRFYGILEMVSSPLARPLCFTLRSNGNTRITTQDPSSIECIRQRADQVILDITYKLCNLERNTAAPDDDDDLIYDKDNTHPSTALIQLLLIKSPNGTDNDKCLFHHLSYETKKHMHQLVLNHIKQLKKFVNYEMGLIQLMLSNHYHRGKDLKRSILQTASRRLSLSEWDSPTGCEIFKEYIKMIFLDAHNDDYFIPPQLPSDHMNVKKWKKDPQEREIITNQIRSFTVTHHQQVLSILFEHFKQYLTQTSWKDKLIVLKLLNMFNYNNMDYKKGEDCKWKTYFSIDFLKTVISETLKEDNVLVQCELVEFIKQFCSIPYYLDMIVDSIEFRDIIKEAFNHIIINQASPYPRLLYFLIKACDPCNYRLGQQIKRIFKTEPFWQEYIVNLSLKALSTTIITLLDRFKNDKDILDHVIRFFNHTHRLGLKEINQLIQRILFSKQQQYQPDQINRFVNVYLIEWICRVEKKFSIYLPSVMKRIIIDQPITIDFWIDGLLSLYQQSNAGGNITTDQISQIIDLIVQTANQKDRDYYSEIGQLIKILVSMDDQWNTIAMISSRVIDMVVDWINQNMELGNESFHSAAELVVDFYDQINIIPPSITISPTTEKISYSEWIDRLILVFHSYYHRDIIKKLKQLKKKKIN
ncbi:hypothetical protein DFA_05098 [Cavenderia fasciculata]|uniref:Uncharacterized protein n=1 Tax=Cavenderia fasciculata TaxID=261658 RepID=F4PNB5_CACFS|nr:uncharacterized protein DFA_05098 [Cavenderia fasciculata]EGG22968.1 hypothetical protein DFA_05098 [Cavenderia fasciculata]|eukprot:XP_004360819.1 hypothetical protein DFA_05098 [Cavenderia fasciculata]